MTVSTESNKIEYVGNGITTLFPYDFLVIDEGHMVVYFDGVAQTSGYTLTGVLDPEGGDVTFSVAPSFGTVVTLLRVVPNTQEISYPVQGPFPSKTHERGLDLGVMRVQQLEEQVSRALVIPIGGDKYDAKLNDIVNINGGYFNEIYLNGNKLSGMSYEDAIDMFGFGIAPFTFTTGGTLTSLNLLVSNSPIDSYTYKYVGAGNAPITVPSGTNPVGNPNWQPFTATKAEFIGKRGGGSVQDFIDSNIKQIADVSSLALTSGLQIGEMVFLKGYEEEGDGASHLRKISATSDGTGIAVGANFANIVTDAGYIDTDWLGPNVTIAQIKTLLDYSAKFKTRKLYSLSYAWALWAARQEFPMAFFGDSTTDGYGTTGHIASVPTPTGVEINESPNAYPQLLESVIKRAIPSYPVGSRVIYNAGFDSQSMVNGFALDKFDSIFIESGAQFLGTKMIGLAWGVTDVINADFPVTALSAYAKNLETLIVYSLSKGIQPFLASPVPMWITGADGRNGWQLLSLINEANKNLAIKYNLEILSLRDSIELDTNRNGNPLTYFLADKVHPNDFGHSAIAGGLFKQLCPNIFGKDDVFSASSPLLMKDNYSVDIIDKGVLPVGYDYVFTPLSCKFHVYLDEARNLVADTFVLGERSVLDRLAAVTITNFNNKTTKSGNIFSGAVDFYDGSFAYLLNSAEFVASLGVGLNEIDVVVEKNYLGTLSFKENTYKTIEPTSPVNYTLTSEIERLAIFSKGNATHGFDSNIESFYLCKGSSTFQVQSNAFNILNSAICFNISKNLQQYNYIKILSDRFEFWSNKLGTLTKTGEGLVTGGFDTSTLVNSAVNLEIIIQSSVTSDTSNDTVIIKVNGVQVFDSLVSTSAALKNLKQGYGVGLLDLDINGTLKELKDIKIVSAK